ncbi:hypothetical protein HYD48_00900 [Mycoplasmopsis bovis]|nr:hypothetical protein [Mycoplasmopsis bovis]QQH77683.1 hypothetical protein HYD48_00900 [Mycoplasmopsis bovis]
METLLSGAKNVKKIPKHFGHLSIFGLHSNFNKSWVGRRGKRERSFDP